MNWWHYLLLVNFYLVLFFGFYALLLRKETFFQLNRVYLVAASLLSFIIPLIQADWVTNLFITQQVQRTVYGGTLDMMSQLTPVIIVSAKNSSITMGQIVNAIYITVTILLTIRLARQLIVLKHTINKPSPSAAYSFFKKISLGEKVSQHSVIAEHEAVHATQWHSVDVMIIEMVMIINWFNPVVYLYRFTIKYIHEFIADRRVVERGTDKADYALLLLSQTFDTDTNKLVTPFYNHSLLKERIKMLQKNKSHRIMLAKYGLSAPLFILMMILSSATVKNSKAINVINKSTEKALRMPAANVIDAIANKAGVSAENKAYQNQPTNTPDQSIVPQNPVDSTMGKGKSRVYTQVDEQPVFPGGMQGFLKFLGDNVRYPKEDRDKKIEGRVMINFIVERDGTVSNIISTRGPSPTLQQAAVDVLLKSPRWKPGIQNGKPVRVSYTVPLNFTLDKAEAPADTGKVFNLVSKMPQFQGGMEAFLKYLGDNVKYPKDDRENGVSGKVFCTFIVERDGTLSDIKALRGPSASMMAEAVRVLLKSPKWEPGVDKDGKAVRVAYTVPINFTLEIQDEAYFKEVLDSLKSKQDSRPLYVIDGKILGHQSPLSNIKQDDIQSMEVLKDKTATDRYGSAGAYGVIIIHTKSKK